MPEYVNNVDSVFYKLTESLTNLSIFFDKMPSNQEAHVIGVLSIIAFAALFVGELGSAIYEIRNHIVSTFPRFYIVTRFDDFRIFYTIFFYFISCIIMDIIFNVLVALILLQLGIFIYSVFGIIYIVVRFMICIMSDQSGFSFIGITRSLAEYFYRILQRDSVLNRYKIAYNTELSKSNDLWQHIKQ